MAKQRIVCRRCGGGLATIQKRVRRIVTDKNGKKRSVTEVVEEVCPRCGGSGWE